jgi:hypothetical protein
LLTATMLDMRSAILMDLSASLPREAEHIDMRYWYISRVLGNELIDTDWVMAPFAREVLQRASADGQQLVLITDQTQANVTQQAVVVAYREGDDLSRVDRLAGLRHALQRHLVCRPKPSTDPSEQPAPCAPPSSSSPAPTATAT